MKKKIKFQDVLNSFEKSPNSIEQNVLQEMATVLDYDLKKLDSDIEQSLKNYVIIRLVISIENFFKNTARILIDENSLSISGIFPNNEFTISSLDIDQAKDNRFTSGRLVAYAINFQNLDEVDRVFSKLISKKFKQELKKATTSFQFSGDTNLIVNFNLDTISELLKLRHKIIHEMVDFSGTNKKLKGYFANCLMLFLITNALIKKKFPKY